MSDDVETIHMAWEFTVDVVDRMTLQTRGLAALVDEDGNFLDKVDRSDERIAADAVTVVVIAALEQVLPDVGLRFHVGTGANPRVRNDDGSYPDTMLMRLKPDGSLNIPE